MIPRLGDGNFTLQSESVVIVLTMSLENDSPSRGRKQNVKLNNGNMNDAYV